MIAALQNSPDDCFTFENDGWVSLRLAPSNDEPPSSDALSAQTSDLLPSNLRWALTDERWVIQGESRGEIGAAMEEPKMRLRALTSGLSLPSQTLDDEEIDCSLAQLGLDWERDEQQWRTSFACSSGIRRDLTVAATECGMRVRAVVANWEGDLDSDCQTALIRFLGQANACFRFARVVLDYQQIVIESSACSERLELELPDSVFGVAAALRAITREVEALLLPELARSYLNINRPQAQQAS